MSWSAISSWIIEDVGPFLPILGMMVNLLVAWLIYKTWRATKAIGKDQSRAYVDAERAELFYGPDGKTPTITLYVRNSGATPAKWFTVRCCAARRQGDKPAPFPMTDFDKDAPSWTSIAGGESLSVGAHPSGLREAIKVATVSMDQVFFDGAIQYETIFGETLESQFRFYIDLPIGRQSRTEGVRVIEVPQKMSRASIRLKAYEDRKARLKHLFRRAKR